MNLSVLWKFMQSDMEADRFENKMRQSENRQKLTRQRNLLVELQNEMKKLESDVGIMQDRLEAVSDEKTRLEGQLNTLAAEIEANPPKDQEEATRRIEAVNKLVDSLSRYEQEVQKLRRDAEQKDKKQHEIRVRAAKTKAEYDSLRVVYEAEYKADTAQLKQIRAAVEKESASIDAALMERYKGIKQRCTPPMAKLVNGQCSGCFMSLPSATMLELKNGDHIVECDNCGRIIYMED